jgi:hypothetical protein
MNFKLIDKDKELYSYYIRIYDTSGNYLGQFINKVNIFVFKHKNSYIYDYNLEKFYFGNYISLHNKDGLFMDKIVYYVDKLYMDKSIYLNSIKYYNKHHRKEKLKYLL